LLKPLPPDVLLSHMRLLLQQQAGAA